MKTFNRTQYLNNECTHVEYYSQFVTEGIMNTVKDRFGKDLLKDAFKADKHFNSIPLNKWDALAPIVYSSHTIHELLKNAKDNMTLGVAVCILKQAALMIIEPTTKD